jgi:hypothetical protein
MLKRIVCFLLGHEYTESTEFYGKLDNGLSTYKLIIGDCIRCGKKPKNKKEPKIDVDGLE